VAGKTPTGDQIVSAVRQFIGDRYVYGAAGPDTFDCSGLVQYTLGSKLGVHGVPRTSESQWAWSGLQTVAPKDLQPGDLIFSDWPGDGASPGHVAFYAGGGKLIEAPRTGVPVHEIPLDAGYRSHVKGYKRLSGTPATGDTSSIDQAPDDKSALAAGLGGIGSELATASRFVADLLLPSTWIRVFAFVIGGGAVGAGLWMLLQEAGSRD
jgi:hypothetical protein